MSHNYLPLVIFVLVIVALLALANRARRRQAVNQAALEERIGVGSEVMTTSGLHGTVVARNDDGSVQLSIAPGVEVTWELAALRDRAALPARYRRDEPATGDSDDDSTVGPVDLEKPDAGSSTADRAPEVDRDGSQERTRPKKRDV